MESQINKICIHKYQVKYKTNMQPLGFADFLRGTISLYQYCKKYGYKLYIDTTEHPIYKYFQINNDYLLSLQLPIYELFEPSYDIIDKILTELFESGNTFVTTTNAFYRKNINDTEITNFVKFDDIELKQFMKDILTPTFEINSKIDNIFKNIYKIDNDEKYIVIHARCGDHFLHNDNNFDQHLFINFKNKMQNIINKNPETKYILITDSTTMGRLWKEQIPEILYWDNNKNHLGDLKKGIQNVEDTIIDFVIMTRAQEIIGGSGFSYVVSVIYDIPIKILNDL